MIGNQLNLIYGNQVFDNVSNEDIHYFDWKNIPHATNKRKYDT